jgi:hypothetical protein
MADSHLPTNIFIDDRMESYRNFFGDDWGQSMEALTAAAPKLDRLVLDLMLDWRGAAYTVSFPAIMLDLFRSFAEGYVNDPEPNTSLLRLADSLLAALSQKLPEISADPQLQRKLRETHVAMAAELRDAQSKVRMEFPIDQIWHDYVKHHVYRITIWSSLRICYVAIYNAYDNYVCQCISTANNGLEVQTTPKKNFNAKFKGAFGEQAFQKCWANSDIIIARLARHSLSHAGGRETRKLADRSHHIHVLDGVLQIAPKDVKELYVTLKDAAYELADVAKDLSEFQ